MGRHDDPLVCAATGSEPVEAKPRRCAPVPGPAHRPGSAARSRRRRAVRAPRPVTPRRRCAAALRTPLAAAVPLIRARRGWSPRHGAGLHRAWAPAHSSQPATTRPRRKQDHPCRANATSPHHQYRRPAPSSLPSCWEAIPEIREIDPSCLTRGEKSGKCPTQQPIVCHAALVEGAILLPRSGIVFACLMAQGVGPRGGAIRFPGCRYGGRPRTDRLFALALRPAPDPGQWVHKRPALRTSSISTRANNGSSRRSSGPVLPQFLRRLSRARVPSSPRLERMRTRRGGMRLPLLPRTSSDRAACPGAFPRPIVGAPSGRVGGCVGHHPGPLSSGSAAFTHPTTPLHPAPSDRG